MPNDGYEISSDELRSFVEREEQLNREKADIGEQIKELRAEAKGRGYDTAIISKLIKLRARNPQEIAEEEALLDTYKAAIGMD